MKVEIKSLGFEAEINDLDGVGEMTKTIADKVDSHVSELTKDLTDQVDTLKTEKENLKEAFGEDVTPDVIKSLMAQKAIAEDLHSELIEEVIVAKVECKMVEASDESGIADLRKALAGETVEYLKDRRSEYVKMKDTMSRGKSQINTDGEIVDHVPDTAFQQGV